MPLAAFALASCLALSPGADRIVAADLARALPDFAPAPAAAEVASAPAPGVVRVFRAPELARLGLSWHVAVRAGTEICFERPMEVPVPAALLAAMGKELPGSHIALLDYSHRAQPEGDIEFPLNGLQAGADGAMWLGWVRYGGNRRFAIWARVEVLAEVRRVVAIADLPPGKAVAAGAVAVETREEFPARGRFAESAEEVVGQWPRLAIRAGSEIRTDQLEPPKAVRLGDAVAVVVRGGTVRLKAEGLAEASGALDEVIPVMNTVSKKRFLARVEGKGEVSVDVAAGRVRP